MISHLSNKHAVLKVLLILVALSYLSDAGVSAEQNIAKDQYEKDETVYRMVVQAQQSLKERHNFEAKTILEQAKQYDPTNNSSLVHELLAQAYQRLGNLTDSINEYKQALQFDPKLATALFNIALAYKDLGQYEDAITWATRFIKSNPRCAERAQIEEFIQDLKERTTINTNLDSSTPDYLDQLIATKTAAQWPLTKLPIKVYVEPGEGIRGYEPSFRRFFFEAFDTWLKASRNRLRCILVAEPAIADIVVVWTDNPADLENKLSEHGLTKVETISNQYGQFQIERCKMWLMTVARDTQMPLPEDEIKRLCLHEIGHALGLLGHSSHSSDIMYFSLATTQLSALTKRDKATITRLYSGFPTH